MTTFNLVLVAVCLGLIFSLYRLAKTTPGKFGAVYWPVYLAIVCWLIAHALTVIEDNQASNYAMGALLIFAVGFGFGVFLMIGIDSANPREEKQSACNSRLGYDLPTMREQLQNVLRWHTGLELKEGNQQAPFCIDSSVLAIAGNKEVLILGRCTKEPKMWHAFFACGRGESPKDHPLDYLKPAVSSVEAGMRVATFKPEEITDEIWQDVVSKVKEVDALSFLFFG